MSQAEEQFGPELVIEHTGQVFSLAQVTVTIGSDQDNSVVLDDPEVAGHHASITWQAETNSYVIEDLGSVTGTYINERPLDEPQPLRHGDVIRVGNTVIDVKLDVGLEPAGELGVAAAAVPLEEETAEPWHRSPLLAGIILVVLAGITIACVALFVGVLFGGGGDVPEVTIQSPADGAQIVVGSEIILRAEADGAEDITLLELSVDDGLVATATSPELDGMSLLTVNKAWTFATTGDHVVSAVAYTARGKTSRLASVEVIAVASGVGEGPTATPTPAPGQPTNTPEPTSMPTPTPEPGATAPLPPQIEYFQVSPASITAGGCTTLQWGAVSYATEAKIEPDVGGVGTPGSTTVCPGETTGYVLTATGPGGTTQASTTVTVIGGLPDLTVDSINFVPQPPVASQDNEVQITIRNMGAGPAGAFDWQWDAGTEGIFDGRVYGLKAGESTVVTVLWKPESAHASLSTEALVDVNDEVPEGDKGNNRLTAIVQVVEAPAQPETARLRSEGALDGYWTNTGQGSTAEEIYVGNTAVVTGTEETVARGFMSFDLSSIPETATVQSVELRFFQKEVEGSPYGKLGEFWLEHVQYGSSLGDSAFNTPALGSTVLPPQTAPGSWYIVADSTIVSWVQGDLASRQPSFQLRLRFSQEVDGDDQDDYIAVEPGGGFGGRNVPQLTVTYVP